MKEIEVLLSKYLEGESSLHEEQLLKKLISEQSDSEYASYKDVFQGFNSIQQTRILNINFERNLLAKLRYQKRPKLYRIFQLTSLSVAASVLLAVGFFTLTQKREAFVIEKGVRCDDSEKAVGYANEAISQAIAPLKQSMQSLQPIKGLEGSLTPSFSENIANDSNLKVNVNYDSMLKTRN